MKIQSLGHVVLKVKDRERSEKFYSGVLGLPICARFDEQGMKMAFFSLGNHHDFAVMEVGAGEASTAGGGVGLDHVAFNIEIQSDDQCPLCILFDRVDNVRGDGSSDSIQTFTSTADSHSACHRAGTESMNFVLSRLSGILLAP